MTSRDVSIVIPVFNEAEGIEQFLLKLQTCLDATSYRYEIWMVDDGSTDGSTQILQRLAASHSHCGAVFLARNVGQHGAVLAGLRRCRGEVVVTIDADGQNPPEEIPRLVELVRAGHDAVGSVRENRQDNVFRKTVSRTLNAMLSRSAGGPWSDIGSMLRAYRRDLVDRVSACATSRSFIPALAGRLAASPIEIPVSHRSRQAGESAYSLSRLFRLNFDLMTSYTLLPVHAISLMGGIVSLGAFGFGLLLVFRTYVWHIDDDTHGVAPMLAVISFFIGALFVGMGILGEYLGRIYMELRAEPDYVEHRVIEPREKS